MSARNEFLEFINVPPNKIALDGNFAALESAVNYSGLILPEAFSGLPSGFKIVSFYAAPDNLLERAFVLRREGWRSSQAAYQRMLMKSKIEDIRAKLRSSKRTFINNLIVILPTDANPVLENNKTADIGKIKEPEPIKISLPLRANSIGIIDGQHRLYSYHRSKNDDVKIAALRKEQNLLVTGIVYPPGLSSTEKETFEAELFLAINSNQTNAETPLKQELQVLIDPFNSVAIGRRVVRELARNGPLAGMVEQHFYQKGRLKTSSIVSFGLAPLVKLGGDDSLFSIFSSNDKKELASGSSSSALAAYVEFAASQINLLLGAIRKNVEKHRWTIDKNVKDRVVSVTPIIAFLILFRNLISRGHPLDFFKLDEALQGLNSFNFEFYHSSQYNSMAGKIFEMHFPQP